MTTNRKQTYILFWPGAKITKTSPHHRVADVDSLSDLGLFNLPRAAGGTVMSMTMAVGHEWKIVCVKFHKNWFRID